MYSAGTARNHIIIAYAQIFRVGDFNNRIWICYQMVKHNQISKDCLYSYRCNVFQFTEFLQSPISRSITSRTFDSSIRHRRHYSSKSCQRLTNRLVFYMFCFYWICLIFLYTKHAMNLYLLNIIWITNSHKFLLIYISSRRYMTGMRAIWNDSIVKFDVRTTTPVI